MGNITAAYDVVDHRVTETVAPHITGTITPTPPEIRYHIANGVRGGFRGT
jgi:hypothetical protein